MPATAVTVSPTAACAGTPSTSWYAPMRSAGAHDGLEPRQRLRRARREQEVERAATAHGAVDEIGRERAVARVETGAAQQRGQHEVRVRAVLDPFERDERDRAGAHRGVAVIAGRVGARRARTPATSAAPVIARLPSGCTSTSSSTPVGGHERAGLRERSRRRVAGTGSSPARARHTFTRRPPTVHHAPGRGLPARTSRGEIGRGTRRVDRELVDGELLGVGRLADLRLGLGARHVGRGGRRAARCPTSHEPGAQLARGLVGADRARAPMA